MVGFTEEAVEGAHGGTQVVWVLNFGVDSVLERKVSCKIKIIENQKTKYKNYSDKM